MTVPDAAYVTAIAALIQALAALVWMLRRRR
jgi:hypothetical protein